MVQGRQLTDLNRARLFLCDIAARHCENCHIFSDEGKAVAYVVEELRAMGLSKGAQGPGT